jgi:23S rRNA (pseudouridine1915-N3)-methyltransferase
MKFTLISLGTKLPSWINQGFNNYSKRIPHNYQFQLIEIPIIKRDKNSNIEKLVNQEGEKILSHIQISDHLVLLEERGKQHSSIEFSKQINDWQHLGKNICLVIGGPDGLADACKNRANQSWSLSKLTLPHPLVRVVLIEQLYRAISILQNHPYHRE